MHFVLRTRFSPLLVALLAFALLPSAAVAQKKGKSKGKAEQKVEQPAEASAGPAVIRREVVCQSNVFYSWSQIEEVPSEDGAAPIKKRLDPKEEFFVTAGESGKNDIDTKNRLLMRLPAIEKEAMEYCRHRHQEASTCVAAHLRRLSDEYQKMDFSSRRAMLDSITNDCREDRGICVDIRASEPACVDASIQAAVPSASSSSSSQAAAENAKGKSKKKKKKK